MSFRTQRLANAFPIWTKLRRDPSSFGHRLLDSFANFSEEQTITSKKISIDHQLLKPYLGIGDLYAAYLDEDDQYIRQETSPGILSWVYPTIVGTLNSVDIPITRYEDLTTMLGAPPDRIALVDTQAFSSYQVWSSTTPYTVVDPPKPERLAIEISNSTFYSKRTRTTDREYSGLHKIQIVGTDQNDISIREYIEVRDDSVLWTSNIFKTVTEVITEGFDGDVLIQWFPNGLSHITDPYRSVTFDDFEGQLRLSLTTQVVDSITYSYVIYSSNRLKLGNQYRRTGIEATSNFETLAEVVLLNSSGSSYTAVDLAINHQTSKMYVLDDQGNVHVYDHGLSPFSTFVSSDVETATTYMELAPLRHYAKFGESEYLYTDFVRNRYHITKIEMKRQDPAGLVEYLQSDKTTWSVTQAYIDAPNTGSRLPEGSWQDFRSSTTYNQLGQWEYTLTTITKIDTTVYVTAVMAPSMTAEVSLATVVSSPTALGFDQRGYIGVSDGSEVSYYQEFVDGWVANTPLEQVIMRTQYDSIEVSY